MEILKTATEWARDEVFSARFFILFGIMFLSATLGFWQLGRTEVAKAFIYPTLVAGGFLLAVGLGLFFTNKARVSSFAKDYQADQVAFIQDEIVRTEKSMNEYQTIVFKVIPVLIAIAALLSAFVDKPIWRAISISFIAMAACIMLVDSNANSRLEHYHQQLIEVQKSMG